VPKFVNLVAKGSYHDDSASQHMQRKAQSRKLSSLSRRGQMEEMDADRARPPHSIFSAQPLMPPIHNSNLMAMALIYG
jgi:hypothetical protein